MQCTAPKCFYSDRSHQCVAPNPWHVFLRVHAGERMTADERKRRYREWLAPILRLKEDPDPRTYPARLCLLFRRRVSSSPRVGLVGRHRERIQRRLLERRALPTVPCVIRPGVLRFLQQFVNWSSLDGVKTLNDCQKLAKLFLGTVAKSSSGEYSIQKTIGSGSYGLVFRSRYMQEPRVIKLSFLHLSPDSDREAILTFKEDDVTFRMSDAGLFERENRMHERFLERLRGHPTLRVPELYHWGIVHARSRAIDPKIGVIVMSEVKNSGDPLYLIGRREEAVRRAIETVRVIRDLHAMGLAHNDLHTENLFFNGKETCIIEFGRATDKRFWKDDKEWLMMRLCDLSLPLLTLTEEVPFSPGYELVVRAYMREARAYMDASLRTDAAWPGLGNAVLRMIHDIYVPKVEGASELVRVMPSRVRRLLDARVFSSGKRRVSWWSAVEG